MKSAREHVDVLVGMMEAKRNPSVAEPMAAYLKNQFECYGIKSPIRNAIQKEWFRTLKDSGVDRWDIVYLLWEKPQRELHYVAIDFLRRMPKNGYAKEDHKKLEELITNHSWWDSVDGLASNCVSQYFKEYPEMIEPIIDNWRTSDNIWLNRTCLIFQLKYKETADFELMKDLILQFMPVKEFFIQKAIGWSLRQHSKVDPQAVRNFIKDLSLSTVAKREAIKYI